MWVRLWISKELRVHRCLKFKINSTRILIDQSLFKTIKPWQSKEECPVSSRLRDLWILIVRIHFESKSWIHKDLIFILEFNSMRTQRLCMNGDTSSNLERNMNLTMDGHLTQTNDHRKEMWFECKCLNLIFRFGSMRVI